LHFVSSGLLRPKKHDNHVNRLNRYLNYGLLRLATDAATGGHAASVHHGGYADPSQTVDALGVLTDADEVLLSLPSFYSVPWAQHFLAILQDRSPKTIVICGGRWVTNGNTRWVRDKLDVADVVEGLGEQYILNRYTAHGPRVSRPLNYSLMTDFLEYQPSIEVSRGCGRGCIFCAEARVPQTRGVRPHQVIDTMVNLSVQYARGLANAHPPYEVRPYLQASNFSPGVRWSAEMAKLYEVHGLEMTWRAEARVDAMRPETIAHLARAGLRVLDLGLESASPSQLLAMGKATNPARYLEKATETLEACNAHGVSTKLNIVLFAGETLDTVEETRTWLLERKALIAGVSANPVTVYLAPQADVLLSQLGALGARPVDARSLHETGIAKMHLSSTIDYDKAVELCLSISRDLMTAPSFFELKRYGYYSPSVQWEDFARAAIRDDPGTLPFRWAA